VWVHVIAFPPSDSRLSMNVFLGFLLMFASVFAFGIGAVGILTRKVPYLKLTGRRNAAKLTGGSLILFLAAITLATWSNTPLTSSVQSANPVTTLATVQTPSEAVYTKPVQPTPLPEPVETPKPVPKPAPKSAPKPAREERNTLVQGLLNARMTGMLAPTESFAGGESRLWKDQRTVNAIGAWVQIDGSDGKHRILLHDPTLELSEYLGNGFRKLGRYEKQDVYLIREGVFKGWIGATVKYEGGGTGLEMLHPGLWEFMQGKAFTRWVNQRI
jgi:hypothetical protein